MPSSGSRCSTSVVARPDRKPAIVPPEGRRLCPQRGDRSGASGGRAGPRRRPLPRSSWEPAQPRGPRTTTAGKAVAAGHVDPGFHGRDRIAKRCTSDTDGRKGAVCGQNLRVRFPAPPPLGQSPESPHGWPKSRQSCGFARGWAKWSSRDKQGLCIPKPDPLRDTDSDTPLTPSPPRATAATPAVGGCLHDHERTSCSFPIARHGAVSRRAVRVRRRGLLGSRRPRSTSRFQRVLP